MMKRIPFWRTVFAFGICLLLVSQFSDGDSKMPSQNLTQGAAGSNDKYVRACYFTNWAQYRPGCGKFQPEDYVSGLCTHILYAFAKFDSDFVAKPFEWNDLSEQWSKGQYEKINALKNLEYPLKTLLSFGGWNFGTPLFKSMSSSPASRRTFIESAMKLARDNGFDGIDIDWEYPSGAEDKANLNALFKEMVDAAKKEARETGRAQMLVTSAVAAGTEKILAGYDVPSIAKYLDLLFVMSYDFHGGWESVTGLNAPLFKGKTDTAATAEWNVAGAANRWASLGMPREKIIVGIPTYGRGWTVTSPIGQRGIGAPGAPAQSTSYAREVGMGAYYEFCELLANGAKRYFNKETKSPYLIYGDQWYSYEDPESIKNKANWIKENNFGGAFVWTLDFDDFNGMCPPTKQVQKPIRYPLIGKIAAELGGFKFDNKPKPLQCEKLPDEASWPSPDTSNNSGNHKGEFQCDKDGFFEDPNNCANFYQCANGVAYHKNCPSTLMFNIATYQCDYPNMVKCSAPPL